MTATPQRTQRRANGCAHFKTHSRTRVDRASKACFEGWGRTVSAPGSVSAVGWLTRRLPESLKRRVPVVRERDALRARVRELETKHHPHPVTGLHGTFVGNDRVLVATTWGGRLLLPSDDLSLMPELVASGTYDPPFTAFVRRHIKPGDTVIDVGAHAGLFTLLLAYQVWEIGRVIAYEPSPRMLELLRDNVTMNWLSDRVEIVPKAAAAASGSLPFLATTRYTMTGSLRPVEHLLETQDRVEALERLEVEAEPLDVHLGRFERIDLVKIDVEGAEEQVFAGMEQLLASGAVRRVSFEVARELMGEEWKPFAERLRRLADEGWEFCRISDAGEPAAISLAAIFERGRFSQVVMQRGKPPWTTRQQWHPY
jgi:FkbM family methyltransferase